MPFNLKEFESASLVQRTAEVPVPGMFDWFEITDEQRSTLDGLPEAEKQKFLIEEVGTVWKVRGLTDDELEKSVDDARGNRARLADVFAQVLDLNSSDVDEIKEKLGADEPVNARTALRAEHVYRGSVNPIPIQVAYKLGRAYPIEFRLIADKIAELSGLGAVDEKKQNPSGEMNPSS